MAGPVIRRQLLCILLISTEYRELNAGIAPWANQPLHVGKHATVIVY